MNDEERYLFDLQGFLLIENAISPDSLERMNAFIDTRAEADAVWRAQTGNLHVDNPILWSPDFLALMDHPRTLPILKEILGDFLRLDHDYGIFLEPGHGGLEMHGPGWRYAYDPLHFYHYVDGRIFCGLSVVSFALTDVPEGAGGLAVIPGSHKSNYKMPEDFRVFKRTSPVVQQVPMKAGDAVVFTERLYHGTLPWKGPGIRRTLFYKYAPASLTWNNRAYFPPERVEAAEKLEPLLTPQQRKLLEPANADNFRRPKT